MPALIGLAACCAVAVEIAYREHHTVWQGVVDFVIKPDVEDASKQ